MSIAGIERVREAELDAENIRKSADEAASEIIAKGKKEAREIVEAAAKEAEDNYKEALKQADMDADRLYQDIIDAEEKACAKIKEDGQAKLDDVVDSIVRKVVGIYGNS